MHILAFITPLRCHGNLCIISCHTQFHILRIEICFRDLHGYSNITIIVGNFIFLFHRIIHCDIDHRLDIINHRSPVIRQIAGVSCPIRNFTCHGSIELILFSQFPLWNLNGNRCIFPAMTNLILRNHHSGNLRVHIAYIVTFRRIKYDLMNSGCLILRGNRYSRLRIIKSKCHYLKYFFQNAFAICNCHICRWCLVYRKFIRNIIRRIMQRQILIRNIKLIIGINRIGDICCIDIPILLPVITI